MNEPSAAAVEFAYRSGKDRKDRAKGGLIVFDWGGGTFDVSLVALEEGERSGIASDGIPALGGDDFDEILAMLVYGPAILYRQKTTGRILVRPVVLLIEVTFRV